MSACRSCGARIVWAETEKGRKMPIDFYPSSEGTIVLRYPQGEKQPLAIVGVPADAFPREDRFTSHFATCPQADEWRGGRRPEPEQKPEPSAPRQDVLEEQTGYDPETAPWPEGY